MITVKRLDFGDSFRRKIIFSVLAVVVTVIVVEIWIANRLSTYGSEIAKLESSAIDLSMENEFLKNKLSQKLSLKNTQDLGKKYGFEKIKNIEYVKDQTLALN